MVDVSAITKYYADYTNSLNLHKGKLIFKVKIIYKIGNNFQENHELNELFANFADSLYLHSTKRWNVSRTGWQSKMLKKNDVTMTTENIQRFKKYGKWLFIISQFTQFPYWIWNKNFLIFGKSKIFLLICISLLVFHDIFYWFI